MRELLSILMAWLVATSDLPAIDEPPRVSFAHAAEMLEIRRHRSLADSAPGRRDGRDSSGPPVAAFYDDVSRTIYLPRRWRAGSPTDVSILVHELVHHIQNVGGLGYNCAGARERPAYRAQARWLELFGKRLSVELGLNEMTLHVRTRCLR